MANSNYTNISDIKDYWLQNIAPNYFDFENTNNYQVGIFGYINEVMAEATEDGFNATNIARKEFYPVSAQYMSSFYKMAALQGIDPPMTIPSQCNAMLIIPQHEIIENSTVSNGVYECTIDSCLKIFADNLQFMLDYPIKILSTKATNGTFVHTIHYDINVRNSLSNANGTTYISNKIMNEGGVNYLIMFIDTIRQLECTEFSNFIQKDTSVNTTSFELDFEGNLANFEVFYKESQNSSRLQLRKVMKNAAYPAEPFVTYEMINANKIRFTFPDNPIFSPAYNSEIITQIYISQGAAGNFESYSGDLVCSSNSEDYPYNANMAILGRINGSASQGKDRLSDEEFRNQIIKAYSTNNTYTIENDLQLFFDEQSDRISNTNLMFRKIRDDAFIRLFGAYVLMKDIDDNVVPTNTVNLSFKKSEVVNIKDATSRIMIKPGTIFQYQDPLSTENFDIEIVPDKELLDITDDESLYFTNPFLIGINISPNLIGYYLNSIDTTKSIQYIYVNDKTANQFVSSSLSMYRNAIAGSNYYEITIRLLPASSDFDISNVVKLASSYANKLTRTDIEYFNPEDDTIVYNIVAEDSGSVADKKYVFDDELGYGYVQVTVKYQNGNEEIIQASTAIKSDGTRVTGYTMNYNVGEEFVIGDILAVRKDDDLGNLAIVGDINGTLIEHNYYIPFVIDAYDEPSGSFTFKAYLATDDAINLNSQITITHGIFSKDGQEDDYLSLPMNNFDFHFCALYDNEGNNMPHKYSTYANLTKYTLTNTYQTNPDDKLNFIESYSFIRSQVDYSPGETKEDYVINVTEMPVLQAWWANKEKNYSYFINKINLINEALTVAYSTLKNNYSIDMKFYNTYGKSKFYKVGNTESGSTLLDSIRCKFRFGISILTLTSRDTFLEKFRAYVKAYIENTSNITTSGQNTYIMNLIAELKNEFSELVYLEYYGFNSYDFKAQKIIGPKLEDFTENYIPEFVNIGIAYTEDGEAYPNIEVTLLDE